MGNANRYSDYMNAYNAFLGNSYDHCDAMDGNSHAYLLNHFHMDICVIQIALGDGQPMLFDYLIDIYIACVSCRTSSII